MRELAWFDATALADLVRKREVSPHELLEAAAARIAALNPSLNAVVRTMFDEARRALDAGLPEGPLRGVPMVLKDLLATYGGVPQSSGSRFLADWVPPHDSELVKRYKRAGLVVVAKTNTPEFGILPTTEPHLFGPSRNPWDRERSTGGSSGGSAAAVAAGMAPIGHANDGGGSIRIPASCCGVFGLKPTRARNPLGPDIGDIMGGFVCEHVVTRSVRDSALVLDVTSGPDVGDPYWAPPPARPFREEVGADPGKLRIALVTTAPNGAPIHADSLAAAADAARLCEELGHVVEEATLPIAGFELTQAFLLVWEAGATSTVEEWTRVRGRPPRQDELEPLSRALAEAGRGFRAHEYMAAQGYLQEVARAVGRFMEKYDLWLSPTLAEPPPPLGTFDGSEESPLAGFVRAGAYVPFTPICNVTGQPAMSVPLYWNAQGLPVGAHFAARFGDEATLFRLAAQLERARPWRDRRPPVAAEG
jgi:amidase